jgi:hypothetical protein
MNAAGMLLNQVKGNLDRNLLENNIFTQNLEPHFLQNVVTSAIDLLTP